jgi:D-alanine-D-alanine ligase
MEINTVPGMSAESIIPQQAKAYGLSVTEFYSKLIDDAIARG